jgi:hypothetical protein
MKLIFREYSGEMYATSLNGIPKPKRKVSEFIKYHEDLFQETLALSQTYECFHKSLGVVLFAELCTD